MNPQSFGDTVQEGRAVGARVKSDDVVGAQARQQLGRPRQRVENRRRHERRVQEEADAVGDTEGAQFGGQGNQVVVVHPDQVVRAQQRQQRVGETGG